MVSGQDRVSFHVWCEIPTRTSISGTDGVRDWWYAAARYGINIVDRNQAKGFIPDQHIADSYLRQAR